MTAHPITFTGVTMTEKNKKPRRNAKGVLARPRQVNPPRCTLKVMPFIPIEKLEGMNWRKPNPKNASEIYSPEFLEGDFW